MHPIYLDYAATTPCEPQVITAMQQNLGLDGTFANSGSLTHIFGWEAQNAIEKARGQIADLLNAEVTEIIFTSGATESNHLALTNAKSGEIISSQIEHSAVLQVLKQFKKNKSHTIKLLRPNKQGKITLKAVKKAITKHTKMVSLMAINNEIGSLNPIYEIGEYLAESKILFHIDAAQAFGKINLDTKQLKADFISICAHKIYGAKGIGALFVRKKLLSKMQPVLAGGGQELGLRGGTLPNHQIVGFGLAAQIAQARMQEDFAHLTQVRTVFLQELTQVKFSENAKSCDKFPGILSLTFANVSNEDLINSVPELAISLGSACNAGDIKPSKVLLALGLSSKEALSSIRVSFGRFTSLADAKNAGKILQAAVKNLQNKT